MAVTGGHEVFARLTISEEGADPREIRQWVAWHVADMPLLQVDVVLLCDQLVSHAENHRGGVREIRLLRAEPGCVRVEVDDGASWPVVRPVVQEWAAETVRLLLIERLCTQWGETPRPDGTTMWAEVQVA
ncbi:ATP-binding protein [Kibdelosporangium aridum]|uniref:ATP-binding protein n=1 Tax=Kibdelosporangium aridum TaxID=2030 RepID=A0A1Y5Y499_KIBAR|nr:hypothetical protein [Kibdelosporangium aridum]SMD25479.1 hypothetical protein SAMN05661093_09165 [Kibdelosporangium aridum]